MDVCRKCTTIIKKHDGPIPEMENTVYSDSRFIKEYLLVFAVFLSCCEVR